jgi:hypothetical protein
MSSFLTVKQITSAEWQAGRALRAVAQFATPEVQAALRDAEHLLANVRSVAVALAELPSPEARAQYLGEHCLHMLTPRDAGFWMIQACHSREGVFEVVNTKTLELRSGFYSLGAAKAAADRLNGQE